jgi:predicted GIY-YIG superfamily endonuclease
MAQIYYVYAIGREEGPVKIGITSNLVSRLSSLNTASSFPLRLIYAQPCKDQQHATMHEASCHRYHEEKRLNGEWFDVDADAAIEAIQSGFEQEQWCWHWDALEKLGRLKARAQ